MSQLLVTANKLNKRSSVPASLSDRNIIGTVSKGFRFEGIEVTDTPNPSLGKWYIDRDKHVYWGGGLVVLDLVPPNFATNIKNLPINLPFGFHIGIDISHHNTINDWLAFKNAGVSSVYIKTSEGVGTRDAKASLHAGKAKENGFKIGYYHFCRPDTRNGGTVISDATAEAIEATTIVNNLPEPGLPLVLDLEDQTHWDTPLKPADYLVWVNTFINTVKERSGLDSMIYSRAEYLDRHLPHTHDLGKYRLWISRYSLTDTNKVICPVGWKDWAMWQYCDDGVIGSNAAQDINIVKDPSLF